MWKNSVYGISDILHCLVRQGKIHFFQNIYWLLKHESIINGFEAVQSEEIASPSPPNGFLAFTPLDCILEPSQ